MLFSGVRIASSFLLFLSQVNAYQLVDASFGMPFLRQRIYSIEKPNYVVELAIFCDKDFGILFNFDEMKVLDYWQAFFYDVHLRFKTLPDVNISFRINSIVLFKNAEEQPFIEAVRTPTGKVPVQEVIGGFQEWLYYQEISKFDYDIGIAALGGNIDGNIQGVATFRGVCIQDVKEEKIQSTLVVNVIYSDPVQTMAHEIAHLLGAPHDDDHSYLLYNCGEYDTSGTQQYIMGSDWNWNGTNGYFFSPCNNKAIYQFLDTFQASCLGRLSFGVTPIINTAIPANTQLSTSVGLSIKRQCEIVMNDSLAYPMPDDRFCLASGCQVDTAEGNFSRGAIFRPFDGSPCNGTAQRCFRGSCVAPGLKLMHVATNQCLGSGNRFSPSDASTLYDCSLGLYFPLNLVNILEVGLRSKGLVIYMWYSTLNGNETSTKCLMLTEDVDKTNFLFKFEKCLINAAFRWELVWLEEDNISMPKIEFILKHKQTGLCVSASLNSKRLIALDCSLAENLARWRFLADNGSIITSEDFNNFVEKVDGIQEKTWMWWLFEFLLSFIVFPYCCFKMTKYALTKTRQLIYCVWTSFKKWKESGRETVVSSKRV